MGEVWTARISSRDPDRFDITHKSGGPVGEVFAPSWAILRPALDARRHAEQAMKECLRLAALPETMVRESEFTYQILAEDIEDQAWRDYVPAFTVEMRQSYRSHRGAWDALVARPRVVLVCYCVDPARCHRTLLAGFLGKLGADVRGELGAASAPQHPGQPCSFCLGSGDPCACNDGNAGPPLRLAPAGGLTNGYAAGRSRKRRAG